jgi:hypothetical protein
VGAPERRFLPRFLSEVAAIVGFSESKDRLSKLSTKVATRNGSERTCSIRERPVCACPAGKAQKDESSLPESMDQQNASYLAEINQCTLQRQLKRKKRFSKKNIIS